MTIEQYIKNKYSPYAYTTTPNYTDYEDVGYYEGMSIIDDTTDAKYNLHTKVRYDTIKVGTILNRKYSGWEPKHRRWQYQIENDLNNNTSWRYEFEIYKYVEDKINCREGEDDGFCIGNKIGYTTDFYWREYDPIRKTSELTIYDETDENIRKTFKNLNIGDVILFSKEKRIKVKNIFNQHQEKYWHISYEFENDFTLITEVVTQQTLKKFTEEVKRISKTIKKV